MNTIRLFWCQGCVQTDDLLGNHKTKSDALFRLLTQTMVMEAPKKKKKYDRTVRVTNTQNEKAEKDNIE